MQAFLYLLPFLATFAPSSAGPTPALEARDDSQCGVDSTVSSGIYTIQSNLWGASEGTGSQCSAINGVTDGSLSWQTTWSWTDNNNNVKSYTNAQSSSTYCTEISSISSIPTSWSWSYTGSDIRANVAYDTFVGSSCGGTQLYEVMVWLGDFGGDIYPLSNNGYPPTPTASPTIGDTEFNLIIGSINDIPVYSFVAVGGSTDFSGDLIDFYQYLETNEGLPSSDVILSIQAGSEVFTGSDCELSTSAYSISQS